MNKEDLLKLKEKILRLSKAEQLQRDEYLKKFYTGEVLGPLTGYSSIDKPWLVNYRDTPIRNIDKVETIYDMVFKYNDPNAIALEFLDGSCSWTFKKLKEQTDKFIGYLVENNIGQGDNFLIGTTNSPELISCVIAIISVGASVKLFDIRANDKEIAEYANDGNCNYMIAMEKLIVPKIQKTIDETNIKKVFVIRPGNSLTTKEKIAYAIKKKINPIEQKKNAEKLPDDSRFIELTDSISNGRIIPNFVIKSDYSKPSFKIQSSGTTGKAKTIVHSEKSAVDFAKSISYLNLPLGEGKSVFVALPPWIAYGIGDAVLMPLALGSKVVLSADFDADALYRNIGSFSFAFAAPFHYRYIRDHYDQLTSKQKKALSCVDGMITGGDKYSALENEQDEKTFGTKVLNGYGNNENWGAMTVNSLNGQKYGSVGQPKVGDTVIIWDSENEMELPYGVSGEVCTLSPTHFLGYENNEVATNKTLKKHADGLYYIHTGDQGYLDKDGFLYLGGRKERVITRLGFKLSAYTIEDAICNLPYVKECIAIEVPDNEEEHVPMVFVVLKDAIQITEEEAIEQMKNDLQSMLKENEIPKHYKVVDALKYTDNNKYDFREYERLGNEFVASLPNGKILIKK